MTRDSKCTSSNHLEIQHPDSALAQKFRWRRYWKVSFPGNCLTQTNTSGDSFSHAGLITCLCLLLVKQFFSQAELQKAVVLCNASLRYRDDFKAYRKLFSPSSSWTFTLDVQLKPLWSPHVTTSHRTVSSLSVVAFHVRWWYLVTMAVPARVRPEPPLQPRNRGFTWLHGASQVR